MERIEMLSDEETTPLATQYPRNRRANPSTMYRPKVDPSEDSTMEDYVQGGREATISTDENLHYTIPSVPQSRGSWEIPDRGRSAPRDSSDAMAKIGRRSHKLIKMIQKLESLHINTTLPSLPKFVVVGDQSAGKSSVIEAACDITLPRNEGTCTRCPFQITTTRSKESGAPWTCSIALAQNYTYSPPRPRNKKMDRLFNDWAPNELPKKVAFGEYTKADLEPALRRAQLANLCPDVAVEEFIHLDVEERHAVTVQFSPNVIELHITGDNLPELSLFDLPGAINVFKDANLQHLVTFIEKLMRTYLGDENSLVLLACSADQDIDNSTSFRYVRECDASERTMGVLTKPDLMSNKEMVCESLSGQAFQLGNGWFVTKQLSQAELKLRISNTDARKKEQQFFSEEPWTTEFHQFADRLGTFKLQEALSVKLTEHITSALPLIKSRVETRLKEVQAEIRNFPGSDVSPSMSIIIDTNKLYAVILEQISPESSASEYRKKFRDVTRSAQKQLVKSSPIAKVSTPGYQPRVMEVNSSDDEDPSPRKRQRGPNSSRRAIETPTPSSRSTRKQTAVNNQLVLTLAEAKQMLDDSPAADLPEQASDRVNQKLSLLTVPCFKPIIDAVFDDLKKLSLAMLEDCVETALKHRETTEYYLETSRLIKAYFLELLQDENKIMQREVSAISHRAMTLDANFKIRKSDIRKQLQRERAQKRRAEFLDTVEEPTGQSNAANRGKSNDIEWVENNIGPDPYNRELDAMSVPIAFYEIASAQLLDTLARHLEYGLIHGFQEIFLPRLITDLKVDDKVHAGQLLADDPERERHRIRMLDEERKLKEALNELARAQHDDMQD